MLFFTVAWFNLEVFPRGGRKQHKRAYSSFLVPCCWITLKLNQAKPNSHYPQCQSTLWPTLLQFCRTTFVETAVCLPMTEALCSSMRPQEMPRKTGLPYLRNAIYSWMETEVKHAVRINTCKSVCLNIYRTHCHACQIPMTTSTYYSNVSNTFICIES